MAFVVRPFVPIATQSKFAFQVDAHYSVDVDTDVFPAANEGDYIEVTDITGSVPVRAWPKAEWEALYTAGA